MTLEDDSGRPAHDFRYAIAVESAHHGSRGSRTRFSLPQQAPSCRGGSTSWLKIKNPQYSQMIGRREVFEARPDPTKVLEFA